jgi:hypothetical protein
MEHSLSAQRRSLELLHDDMCATTEKLSEERARCRAGPALFEQTHVVMSGTQEHELGAARGQAVAEIREAGGQDYGDHSGALAV